VADPGLALHKALLARLDPLSCPVYDAVPQNAAFPYVTLDTSVSQNIDYLVERNDERFVFFNVWSEVRGQAEVLAIMGQMDALLHNAALTLDAGRSLNLRVERTMTQRDADNLTFMGQLTLRVITRH